MSNVRRVTSRDGIQDGHKHMSAEESKVADTLEQAAQYVCLILGLPGVVIVAAMPYGDPAKPEQPVLMGTMTGAAVRRDLRPEESEAWGVLMENIDVAIARTTGTGKSGAAEVYKTQKAVADLMRAAGKDPDVLQESGPFLDKNGN